MENLISYGKLQTWIVSILFSKLNVFVMEINIKNKWIVLKKKNWRLSSFSFSDYFDILVPDYKVPSALTWSSVFYPVGSCHMRTLPQIIAGLFVYNNTQFVTIILLFIKQK